MAQKLLDHYPGQLLFSSLHLLVTTLSLACCSPILAEEKRRIPFWKNIIPSTLTSLGTCSSAAAIPSNFIAAKKIGVPDDIANITIPMGANLHKDGAVLIQILKIVFMCSIFNINILEPGNLITAIMVSVVASCVMGAIPGGGYVGEIFIVSAFGFPEVAIPIMVLIGTITDAPATAINATGDVGAAMVVSRVVEGKDWINDGAQEAA